MRDAALQGLAVGFFDGVHLGHQAILKGADAALTFRNHPLTVLVPEKAPRLIMSVEERIAAIKACGVKHVTVLDFTPELAALTPEEFVERYLLSSVARLQSSIRCGANWRFGKGGVGDAAFLRERGLAVEVAPYAEYKGERVSSSRIRRCLENGEIEDANAMLGRRFQVSGFRFQGKGLGTKLGYPTVNFKVGGTGVSTNQTNLTNRVRLPLGVYVVELEGVCGIANYGYAPTMGPEAWKRPVLEVHFPSSKDSSVQIRSDSLTACCISILRFVRPERKFDSVADLQRQIVVDCATIKA